MVENTKSNSDRIPTWCKPRFAEHSARSSHIMKCVFPVIFKIRLRLNGNTIHAGISPPRRKGCRGTGIHRRKDFGLRLDRLWPAEHANSPSPKARYHPNSSEYGNPVNIVNRAILTETDIRRIWLRTAQTSLSLNPQLDWAEHIAQINSSWAHQFYYRQEIRLGTDKILENGLRPPQIGALHAVLSHWTTSLFQPLWSCRPDRQNRNMMPCSSPTGVKRYW